MQCDITLNRKMLSELAVHEPMSFKSVVDLVKQSCGLKEKYVRFWVPIQLLSGAHGRIALVVLVLLSVGTDYGWIQSAVAATYHRHGSRASFAAETRAIAP